MTTRSIAILFLILWTMSETMAAAPDRVAHSSPQDTLDEYFSILTTRNVQGFSNLMASDSMSQLKALMIDAFEQEKSQAGSALQRRLFGREVTMDHVRSTPASFYLQHLANEILNAADMQHFFVETRDIIGSVKEGDDMVHFVVGLYLQQDTTRNSDVLVYTLVRENGKWKLEFPPTIRADACDL